MIKTFIFVLLCFVSIHTYADVNCKFKITDPIIDWTGGCENGLASGIGELTYTREGIKVVTFGKFQDGHATGLQLSIYNNLAFIAYWTRSKFNKIGPAYSIEDLSNLPPMKRRWADSNAPPISNIQPDISYEEALNQTKIYIAQKSDPSIDFEVFKAYLEGRVKVMGEDDPPVLGAALKPNGSSKKKEK